MINRCMQLLLAATIALVAQTDILTPISGKLMVIAKGDSVAKQLEASLILKKGDRITVESSDPAVATLNKEITLHLKDSCILLFAGGDMSIVLELENGQVFMDKKDGATIPVEISSKGCTFSPIGTAAAVKLTQSGNPSVAVLSGTIKMRNKSGNVASVGAGEFASFNSQSGAFSPVKPLPQTAIDALSSWTGVTLDKPQPKTPATPENESITTNTEQNKEDETSKEKPLPKVSNPTPPAATTEAKSTTEPPSSTINNTSSKKDDSDNKQPPKSLPRATSNGATTTTTASTNTPSTPDTNDDTEIKDSDKTDSKQENNDKTDDKNTNNDKDKDNKPQWEISAGMVTVDGEQWTRIALGVDVPIWKFGVFFDIELFLDTEGNFSNKGWSFSEDPFNTIFRKIRYVRFNRSGDPVHIKVGGLNGVTYGYGFIVDRFTNMLDYPGEKLLGLQFELNDISPIGLTLQMCVPDFKEFTTNGGFVATRIGLRPLKAIDKPIISKIRLAATYAIDLNQYAPAQEWRFEGDHRDKNANDVYDLNYLVDQGYTQDIIDTMIVKGDCDTTTFIVDTTYRDSTEIISVLGADIVIPIITSKIINLDLYGQAATTLNDEDENDFQKGWGIGAPGVSLNVGPLWARLEYRRTQGKFTPSYFGTYYLDERITRRPVVKVKEEYLVDEILNGVFGNLGFNIKDVIIIDGRYQILVGEEDINGNKNMDQRLEGLARIGDLIMQKVPKINRAEIFFSQTNINGNFFEETEDMYWGYRLGVEMLPGTGVIWETRYGWVSDESGALKEDKSIKIIAALSF